MEITAKGVRVSLGEKEILKGIDFEANDGEFIGIIGPNGSGKSTFLKCIYRIIDKYSGEINLRGLPLNRYSYRETSTLLSVVSQHNYYSFDFKVKDILLMGRTPYKKLLERDTKDDFDRVYEALKIVGMENFADRNFSTLSGGERQRVILGRALCQDTPILILDEPTNHLDINYQIHMMNIVKKLDKTIISAIHDLDIASLYCDKIFAIQDGSIVAKGTPNEVLTEKFIKEVYGVDAEVFTDRFGRHRIMFQPEVIT